GLPPERMMVLGDETGRLFGEEVETLLVRGMPKINEVVCLHKESRTLIIADLLFNLAPAHGLQRWLQKANGVYQRLSPSRMFRMFISDRKAFRQSLDHILAWDFDRIIVGHGANIPSGGNTRLREVFNSLGL